MTVIDSPPAPAGDPPGERAPRPAVWRRALASTPLLATALAALALLVLSLLAAASLDADPPLWALAVLLVLLGVGPGMFGSPNNSAIMGDVARERIGTANGILSTTRNLGRAVGVAVVALGYSGFAGTAATSGVPVGTFLAGFRGVLLVGAAHAAVALGAVAVMHRRTAGRFVD